MSSISKRIKALEELIRMMDQYWDQLRIDTYGLWINDAWSTSRLPDFEISCLVEGHGEICINNECYQVEREDLWFCDLEHNYFGKSAQYKLNYITFSTEDPEVYLRLKDCCRHLSHFIRPHSTSGLDDFFTGFHLEASTSRPLSSLLLKTSLLNILVRYYRFFAETEAAGSRKRINSRHEVVTSDVIKYLHEHYGQEILLGELAKQYSLNAKYLNSIFKSITGTTIIQYLIHLRIEKAKRLLAVTPLKVTDIALETGFYDCQHFCNIFKKAVGTTPAEYRSKTE